MDYIDHIIAGAAAAIATVSLWMHRRTMAATKRVSRVEQLRIIVNMALDAAAAHKEKGNLAPLQEVALKAALIADTDIDGKQDFTREQLRVALEAEGHRRGLW